MNPVISNIIIIVIIAGIVVLAVRSTMKKVRGESSCCGGGDKTVLIKPQKLSRVIAVKNITVEGMVCDNCAARIHNVLNSIDGINAKVIRSRNMVSLKLGKDIDDDVIRKAIEDLGYSVTGIENG